MSRPRRSADHEGIKPRTGPGACELVHTFGRSSTSGLGKPIYAAHKREESMVEAANALVLDLVVWVAREPRPYQVVIAAWRTSCPRLTNKKDADETGYVT